MLVTLVPSTGQNLTSVTALRDYLGDTSTADATRRETAAVSAASRWAEAFVGRPLSARLVRETVAGYGGRNLMLAARPVRAVVGLYTATDTGQARQALPGDYRVEDAEAGLLSRDDGWSWTVPLLVDLGARPDAGQESRPWMVDYVAGYTLDGIDQDSPLWSTEDGTTSTGRSLPGDIEEAVLVKAAEFYRQSQLGTVKRERLGDLEVEYFTASDRVAQEGPAEQLLALYRSIV